MNLCNNNAISGSANTNSGVGISSAGLPSSSSTTPSTTHGVPTCPSGMGNGTPVVISYTGLGEEEEYTMDSTSGGNNGNGYIDSSFQCIRFQPFQQQNWCPLYDENFKEM